MNPRQRRFADEYVVDLNATQAAIRAGYSTHTAEQQGPRLLGNVEIAEAIQAAQQARSERVQITADDVLSRRSRNQ
jgi:phage terminase small subunit